MAGTLIPVKEGADWIERLWKFLWKRREQYKKDLEEMNTIIFGDPLEIAQYYVEPKCQDVNPADHHDTQSFASQEPVMEKIDQFLKASVFHHGDNQMFVLSDAGMGKTALLTMLKLGFLTAFWNRRKACVLKKLGHDTLDEIARIENKRETLLLLDSLDEDPTAYDRVQERLLDILKASQHFYRVIITCRTQFFPEVEQDPMKRPGFFKIDQFTCPAKYLSFFSDDLVEKYLAKRFPKRTSFLPDRSRQKKLDAARAVIGRMGHLRCRPMLLSYIDKLMGTSTIDQQSNEYHIYDALVANWLMREKSKAELPEKDLLKACIILATVMQVRKIRSISEAELNRLIERISEVLPVKAIEIKGRSLINRNSNGDYRFSHYSIQEFLVAKLLLEEELLFKPRRKIPVTDFMVRLMAMTGRKPHLIAQLDFENLNFRKLDLRNIQLPGAVLAGADLREANFENADLRNADLREALTEGANFTGADLAGAKMIKNELGMEFVFVPSGKYFMQTTPVTQRQWQAVMGNNPSHFKNAGENCPVENVSWNDAQKFIQKLNGMEGHDRYRLPTEAEWEYACRAGTTTAYYTGDTEADLDRAGWYSKNSGSRTHPVGEKEPNAFGLYDMHGNVWEWCEDQDGAYRVLRGGAWFGDAGVCRTACRGRGVPGVRDHDDGFRLALRPGQLVQPSR